MTRLGSGVVPPAARTRHVGVAAQAQEKGSGAVHSLVPRAGAEARAKLID